jgi:L-iditol 2-dehydrogenase
VKRARLTAVERLEVESVTSPPLGAGEVRVRVVACGICGSDLHMYRGDHPMLRPPLVMGHELVGRVVERGPGVRQLGDGQRVVVIAGRGCGACAACQAGQFNWCEALQVIGGHLPGGLAEEIVLPEDQFIVIPDSIPDEQAVLIEVAAVALHSIDRGGPVVGRVCLVLGAGPVGLVLIKVLKAVGAGPVVVTEISSVRRQLAAACGADLVIEPASEARVRQVFSGGLDVAYECAGREESLRQALRLTRRGGTVVLVAIFPEHCTLPMTHIQRAERSLVGVQMYQRADFERIIHLLETRQLDLSSIVTNEVPLAQAPDAFRLLSSPDVAAGKILVRMT